MWFLGMLIGLLLGAPFGGETAVGGALIGLVAGILAGVLRRPAGEAAAPAATEERLKLLEDQVAWLRRESVALRAELAALGGGSAGALTPAASQSAASPEAPSVFIDETPTQPGYDFSPATLQADAAPAAPPRTAADGGETVRQAETRAAPDEVPAAPTLWQRLMAGNPLAKIGVVLLFFGVASALRLAADYGFLPVPLRLLLGAVAGTAMVAFGWHKVRQGGHFAFGIALQGGGFAILYLIVYFMLARYGLLGPTPSFALFALLGVACVLLAVAQDGVVLAVFGLAGAFAAPVLASTGSGDPVGLFGYFALLNAFIVGVSWFKAWRLLNVTGFVFTLGVGVAWALQHYHAGHHDVCQGFLVFFWALYAVTPVLMALFRAPGWAGWSDATLVFGTPLVGFALQSQLAADRYELAWAAFAAALAYGALWCLLFRRGDAESRLLERCQLGLAIAFATLAVPLAFGVQVTAAFWALEGVAVLWFGVAQGRRLAMATGSLLQAAAGAYFLYGLERMSTALPVINDVCLGAVLLAGAGFASARLLRRFADGPAAGALLWAFAWWCFAGGFEIDRLTTPTLGLPLLLAYVAGTLTALEILGRGEGWRAARHLSLLLLPALWLGAALAVEHDQHFLPGLMVIVLPLAIGLHTWALARQEADDAALWPTLRHVGGFWLLMALVTVELAWLGDRLAPGVQLWLILAAAAGPALGLGAAVLGERRQLPPVAGHGFAYLGFGSLLPAAFLAGWAVWANFGHAGGGSGLPYVPVLNPFDGVQLAVMGALLGWLRALNAHSVRADPFDPAQDGPVEDPSAALFVGCRANPYLGIPAPSPVWVGVLAFIWVSCLAARIAHHWGGVPFTGYALWHSNLVQALLTFLWTALAIAAMIAATRVGIRRLWQGGFALLAVVGAKLLLVDLANAGTVVWTASLIGVALLVLAAGYFAPAPPAVEKRESAS